MNYIYSKVLLVLNFLKSHKKIALFLILAIAATSFYILRGGNNSAEKISKVALGSVTQEVSITGRVKASKAVDLAFDRSGRVSYVGVKSADFVKQGKVLIQLDDSEILAQEQREVANVAIAEQRLKQLMAVSSVGESDISSTVDSLSKALKVAIDSMIDFASVQSKYFNVYTGEASNIAQAKDEVMTKIYSENNLGRTEAWYFTQLNSGLKKKINDLESGTNNEDAASLISEVRSLLLTEKSALELLLSGIMSESNVPDSEAEKINADIDLVIGQLTSLSSQNKSNINEGFDIEIAKSQLEQSKASLALVRAQLSKYRLVAPFSGVATNVDIKTGHIVSPNLAVVSLMTNSKFQIEANVSEADISKISIGNEAVVKLDAYGRDQTFNAKLVDIDPGGRVIDGVATYKVILEFASDDDRILSGLTADVDIVASKKENVLFVSSRDVFSKDGKKYVKVKIASDGFDERFANLAVVSEVDEYKVVEVPIETGLKGSDGRTEIVSGLKEGDLIISD